MMGKICPASHVAAGRWVALHVISGEFGNDKERKRQLESNYAVVQRQVNKMLS